MINIFYVEKNIHMIPWEKNFLLFFAYLATLHIASWKKSLLEKIFIVFLAPKTTPPVESHNQASVNQSDQTISASLFSVKGKSYCAVESYKNNSDNLGSIDSRPITAHIKHRN